MNLYKIGKFIQERRKIVNLTQEELAEKLYVTDRAVSKWERGLSLPDAGKMIDLSNILNISVNELLIGEKMDMKDSEKKTEELLVEMAKEEEKKNKKLFFNMWVLLISTFLFYIGIVLLASTALEEGIVLGTVIVCATILSIIVAFYALKIEVETGYYECTKCKSKHTTTYLIALISPHLGTTRLFRCPDCKKICWQKKTMTKE